MMTEVMKNTEQFPIEFPEKLTKDDKEKLKEFLYEKEDCFVKIIKNCKIFEFVNDKKYKQNEAFAKMKCGVC